MTGGMQGQRILILAPDPLTPPAGGIARVVQYTLSELEQSGQPIQMRVVTARLTHLPILKHISTLFAIFIYIKALISGTDLVHINVAPKGSTWRKAVFAWIAHRFGVPVVLHLHGAGYDAYFAAQSSLAKRLIRLFFQAAQGVIVLGTGWRDWAVSAQGLSLNPSLVHIIDNGVPDPKVAASHENAVPRIVFVGLVGQRKGVDTLLEALAQLPEAALWTCTICGNGEVAAYEAKARALGFAQSQVAFLGWQSVQDVRHNMAMSDIYVLPSRAENQPVAILEAMAIGLPVVSTLVGDIPNQVVNGVTGYVVPPSDAAALADALAQLVASPQARKTMGAAGRKRYEQRYSSADNLAKTLQVYADILD